jgi:CheY-like chemotaxis protein
MKTILIVEDVELNSELLVQLLEDRYRLVLAVDGIDALQRVRDEQPDLILMDLSLPRMDGWEAARKLKADAAFVHIPIIALSAHAMHSHEERARASGCDDFLAKPVEESLLYQKIARYLGD